MKKKVAIVYPFFAHYRAPIINELSHDNEIEYFFWGGDTPPKNYSSLKLHDFKDNSKFSKLKSVWIFKYFLVQFGIISNIRSQNIDSVILLADWKYISYWVILLYCKLVNKKCYFWSHGLLNSKRTLNNKIKFFFHSLFDGGLVYSERSSKFMKDWGFKKTLLVVNNSLDFEVQNLFFNRNKDLQEDNLLPFDKPYIIFSARLIKERRLELLFDALTYLRDNNKIVNLLILGSGPYESFLKQLILTKNLENQVHFGGSCYDENLLCKYFMNSEMCVFPGSIGLTIIHSMTYGIPVITHDNLDEQKPEIEALIDGVNGYFYKENDYVDLAFQISRMLDHGDKERAQFRNNCRMSISNKYTPKAQSIVFKNLLNLE